MRHAFHFGNETPLQAAYTGALEARPRMLLTFSERRISRSQYVEARQFITQYVLYYK